MLWAWPQKCEEKEDQNSEKTELRQLNPPQLTKIMAHPQGKMLKENETDAVLKDKQGPLWSFHHGAVVKYPTAVTQVAAEAWV